MHGEFGKEKEPISQLCPFFSLLARRTTVCSQRLSNFAFPTGGSSTTLTGDPTKRVKVCADIWSDQPDVPVTEMA